MTTRSNVHYSVDAESLQRAIDNVLPENLQTPVNSTQSVRASTARPRMQTAIPAPVAAVMDPHLLLTPQFQAAQQMFQEGFPPMETNIPQLHKPRWF
jgi:hypothetical protein